MAVNISFYDKAIINSMEPGVGTERINYEDGPIYAALMITDAFDKTQQTWSQIENEQIAAGTGYADDGTALANPTLDDASAGTVEFDADDHSWVASGGTIPTSDGAAQHLNLRFSGTNSANEYLIAQVNFGASETAGNGTKFLITWDANGIFRIS